MGFEDEDDDGPFRDEDERDAILEAAAARRGLWCETAVSAVRSGATVTQVVIMADNVLAAFDLRFPEVKNAAELEELPG